MKKVFLSLVFSILVSSCSISNIAPISQVNTKEMSILPNEKKAFSIKAAPPATTSGIMPEGDFITVNLNGVPKNYKFYGVAGKTYKIKLSEISNPTLNSSTTGRKFADAALKIYAPNDPDATSSIYSNDDMVSGLTQDSFIQFTANTTGFWTIKASNNNHENTKNNVVDPIIPATGEYELSLNADSGASHPVVAQYTDGSFVIAWQEFGSDGSGWGIYARKFDKDGKPLTKSFRVNDTTIGDQSHPAIAMENDGHFVITWQGNGFEDKTGIYFKRYTNEYTANGANNYETELRINYATDGVQCNPAIAIDNNFHFIITWQTTGSTNNTDGIYAGRFGSSSYGEEAKVNESTGGYRGNPKISLNQSATPNSYFVIIWEGSGNGDDEGIYQRRFNMQTFVGKNNFTADPEYRVNYGVEGYQNKPEVAIYNDNKFIQVWQSNNPAFPFQYSIFTKVTNENDSDIFTDLPVNATGSYYNSLSSLSLNNSPGKHNGDFIIAWQGISNDNKEAEINERRFNINSMLAGNAYIDFEYRSNYLTSGVQGQVDTSLNMNSTGDTNLVYSDINYSRMVKVWSTRNSEDNTDGIYYLLSRSNSFSGIGLPIDTKVNQTKTISGSF